MTSSDLGRCRIFPGEERQLGLMRQWLRSLLPECPARDDLLSIATELGSNAVLHTRSGQGGWFGVEINCGPQVLRVTVTDRGGPNIPQVIDVPDCEHGRGMRVVQALSASTGQSGDHNGRQIWAEIAWEDPVILPADRQTKVRPRP
jgi:anti-sigma regulatory factor (Ser/Thr protein kinase)